jgi:gamma-glutamylcyclotransferase (GGCT)/AIG2-like uncharacterized protein YtfP
MHPLYREAETQKEKEIMHKVFVYGTLKTGETEPMWVKGELFSLGAFPAAINVGVADSWIKGEVREVDDLTLKRFDQIEGTERNFYRRIKTFVYGEDKNLPVEEVWIYEFCNGDRLSPSQRCGEEWDGRINAWGI